MKCTYCGEAGHGNGFNKPLRKERCPGIRTNVPVMHTEASLLISLQIKKQTTFSRPFPREGGAVYKGLEKVAQTKFASPRSCQHTAAGWISTSAVEKQNQTKPNPSSVPGM